MVEPFAVEEHELKCQMEKVVVEVDTVVLHQDHVVGRFIQMIDAMNVEIVDIMQEIVLDIVKVEAVVEGKLC